MTYDPGHGQAVLFGGTSGAIFLNDTWLWNGTAWTLASPSLSPSARSAFAMTYDAAHGQVILFGGRLSASSWTNDTWLWNGTTWTQATPGTVPPARSNNAMVYDAARGNVVMFGGLVGGLGANDTWIWNGTNWTQMFPSVSPSPRSGYSMAYDPVHQQVVLFGGSDQFGNNLADTWVWNGTNWAQQSPAASPTPRFGQGMVWDTALGQIVLFGGTDGSNYFGDTWSWNGTTWIQRTGSSSPPQREAFGMVYEAAQSQVLIFGGFNGSFLPDTWEWSTPQNFGNVNVCPSGASTPAPCNKTLTLTYSAPSATIVGSVQVVTQGTAGLDFTMPSYNCAVSPGTSTCSVNVQFAPGAPGLRLGAVELFDGSGNLLVSTPVYGNGQAPLTAFTPATQTTVVGTGTLNGPEGVAVDTAGDVFVADTSNARVLEIAANSTQSSIGFNLSLPQSLAIDGAGDLFIADNNSSGAVIEIPSGCSTATCQKTIVTGLQTVVGVAVDGLGDLFFSDNTDGEVAEIPASGGSPMVVYNQPLSAPRGLAVDSAGDLFIAAFGFGKVIEVPAGCTNSGCYVTIGIGWSEPQAVAVDAAGDVYVADQGLTAVVEVPAGCTTGVCQIIVESGPQSLGVALDAQGDVYYTDIGAGKLDKALVGPNALALGFGSQPVGSQSTAKSFTVQNIGNQTLGAISPGLQITDADFVQVNASSPGACTSGFSLTPGAVCNTSIAFSPLTQGPFNGLANFTDNSLNASPATQGIVLVGTGVPAVTNYTLTVTPIGSGAGTVTDNSNAISCAWSSGNSAGTCAAPYSPGSSVILTANANPGSIFLGWGGACAGLAPTCQISMIQAFNVTASFSQQNFGSDINVCPPGQSTPGPCSTSIPVTINIPTTTTIGAIQVVTQGVTGLDFSLANAGTCTGTITGGTACTVNVNFAPLAPGSRLGAVELSDTSGNPVITVPIYGIGQGPAAAFSPSVPVLINTGNFTLDYPAGLLVDAVGNLFIAEGDVTNKVLKIAPNGSISTVGSGFALPQGMAEDGAGDLFVANNNLNEVIEIPAGCTTSACQVPLATNLRSQLGVAVDGTGDLFVGDFLDGEVVEIPAGCTTVGCQRIIYSAGPAAGSSPVGLTADAAGDVYVADLGRKVIVEVPAGCTVANCQKIIGLGLNQPVGVAVDAAGDVFIADQALQQVIEVPVNCAASTCQIVIASGIQAVAVAVDSSGNLVIDNVAAATPQVFEVPRSLPPSLNFALTGVGGTSADSPQAVSIQNVGNQTLSGGLSIQNSLDFVNFQQTATCNQFNLAPGAVCSQSFSFTPQSAGVLTDTRTFSDNTMNLAASVSLQAVNMSGIANLNGATGTVVPNVVGMTASAAATAVTSAGLTVGSVSNGYSSSEPQGSVSGESPAAGSPVNLGSAVNLMVASGQAPSPSPNPLTLENNYFVTGDFATAGVTLTGAPATNGMSAGTITIPDLTSCNCSQGVPDGADIVDGFLYWTTLESPGSTPSGNTGTFLGYPIVGQQIGLDVLNYNDGSKIGTLRVYRADVNNYFQVQPGWNGERLGSGPFAITLPSGAATQSGFPITEGASLVVIYRVLSLSVPLKSVVVYDGSVVPTASATQTVQGFYDALGGANAELATLSATGANWNGSLSLAAHASQYTATLAPGTPYAAVVFSTPVTNSDNDGILDAWKAGPGAPDFFAGQPGYYDVKTQSWVALPGAKHGNKDLFVQFDWMCGNVVNGQCTGEDLFPSPDVNGNDPLAMVQQAFKNAGVTLHLEPGNPVAESTCTDTPNAPLCQFPNQPGVIDWKNGLEFSKLWPRNYSSCLSGGDCTARFPYGQKDSYHYVLFGHSLAIPAWNTRFGTLTAISADPIAGTTTITTTDRGPATLANGSPSPIYCSTRFTIAGVQGLPSLNGVFAASCPNSTTIILTTPSLGIQSTWTYPNTMPEPDIGLTSGTVTSISGYSDLGGADSAVTLALWETDPQQDMSKRAQVIAGTLLHEIGHTLGLSHGGLYYSSGSGGYVQNGNPVPFGSYIPNFDINCKPNYQSSMNYLFQLDGVGPANTVTFSNQTLETLTEGSLGTVTNLLDVNNAFATYPGSAWYSSTQPPNSTETQASRHCDGTPLKAGETGYFVEGSVAPVTPAWTADQNLTFDGVQPGSTGLPGLVGYNDQANMDLRQVGATGGEFASLANVLSFGSSPTPLSILSGGTATLGAGGTVTLGAGGSVTLVNGGSITVGSGAVISGGGAISFGTAGSVTVTTNSTIAPGANGTITLAGGDVVTLTSAGTFTFLSSGGTVTLGGGGTVTLGGGGSITLNGGGTVTIPETGGSYDIPAAGGTVTLGGGGTVTLGGGGTATLGGGGTATLGGGGTVTLGGGGTATLGAGGTVTLGGGGTATLGGGGTVTLGGGGTVTLGGGGTATLGGGGTVTLGGGGTVTLGGGGTATLGGGGTATLGAGGTATLGAGGTVTLGAGGSLTMDGAGGTVTLGGGGTVTLGGGGTVTLGGGGSSPITVNGAFAGTCSGSCTVPAGGTVTLGGGGTVTLGGGGTVTLGGGGTVTLGGGGTVTLGGGGVVTLGGGGAVTLGGGGTATLGGGGTATLGGGGTATLGGGGNLATELDYATADSVARPPSAPTYSQLGNTIQVNWTAPIFGVVQTYTISREVDDPTTGTVIQAAQVIGSVSGVGGSAPATTFTDTNPPTSGKVIYTITTTLAPDPANPTQLQSAASAPAVLTVGQTIVLGPLPSSVVLGSTQPTTTTVTATAEANGTADMQLVSFSASGPCSAAPSTMNANGVSSATVTLASTGTCTITASQAGDSTTATTPPAYSAATPVSGTFTILPQGSNLKSQTINFGPLSTVQYGSGFSVTASSSAGQPVSLSANGPCTLTTTSSPAGGTTSAAGLCLITATAQAGNGYTGASLTQSFNITAAPLTVTANSLAASYGQPLPPLTYTFGPLVNGDVLANVVTGNPALATTAVPLSGPGAYPITVSPGSLVAANYAFDLIGGTLTITPATTATSVISSSPGNASNFMQQVTFTATVVDSSPGSLGTAPTGTVNFYSNGGLIGTGTLAALPCTTPPCASQAMVSPTTLAPGSDNITASYSGDANYYPSGQGGSTATGLTQTVTPVAIVSLNPASLSFGNINVGKSSSAPVTLTNTGDANLSIGSVQVTGPNMADFTATSNCPSSLGYASGSNSCIITVKFTPSQTGVETATLQITDNADNTPGSQQFVALTGSGLSSINGTSVYTDAIFSNSNGCGAITVSSGSTVNSFNSSLGYASSQQNSGGNVGTNGNVTLGSGGTIYGTAATDVLTTGQCSATSVTGLTTSSGGNVTGGLVALNGPVNYPAPPAPNPAPPTTNQTISGSCPGGMSGCSNTGSKAVTLAPGRYGNVTASNGTTLHLSAGTYFFNSLKFSGGSVLHLDSGPVIVNLAGASLTGGTPVLDFTGGGMENPGGIPGNLQFIYGGSQGLNLAGGASAYAAVYAPHAPVNLAKGTDFFGSINGSTVTSSSGTAIHYDTNLSNVAQGSTIWFAAVVNSVKGLPANQQVKLYMTNGSISFTANNTQYTVPVPNAVVTLNSSISGSKSAAYDLINSRWSTSIASTNLTGNTFVTGVAFPVPVALPSGIQNVTWSAAFSTDTPGITLQWQWNAQVYTQFSQTYATTTNANVLGVNAEDGSADAYGTDPAGTPESYKPYATFGATDGYFSAASGVVPTVAQVSVSPSSLSFGTVPVGQTSSPMTAVLTNNYGSGFTIGGIAVSGTNANDFLESDNCPRTSGGFTSSCTITVTFKPGYTTQESAKIVITDTANNSPQTVYLSGTGQ